jgi:Rrf2 family protein
MSTSCRFTVAVHILTAIALQEGKPVPSEMIASSVASHPTVIRRILSMLNKSGITRAQLGKGGGALLARPANDINLLQVHQAVEQDVLFAAHRNEPSQECMVGRHLSDALHEVVSPAKQAMKDQLAAKSLQQVVDGVLARGEKYGGLFIKL